MAPSTLYACSAGTLRIAGLLESLSTKATAQLRVLEPFVVELRVERAWCEYNVIKCDCANIRCNGHIGTLGDEMNSL